MAKLNLSLSNVEMEKPKSEFWTVPAGKYTVKVGKAEIKETRNGGAAVIFGYEIQDGEYAGKLIKDFVNIINQNPEAQRIGLQRLKTVAFATGFEGSNLDDTDQLIGKESFEVVVDVKEQQVDDKTYNNNVINAVLVTRDVTKKAAPTSTAAKKPWQTK